MGKPAKLIDHSMTSAANEKDGVCSPEGSNIGKRAFEDLTDLQNDEFIVSGCLFSMAADVLTGCGDSSMSFDGAFGSPRHDFSHSSLDFPNPSM